MAKLRENLLIYLATLLTLSTMALSLLLEGQGGSPIRYLAPLLGLSGLLLAFWPIFTLRKYGGGQPGESYMEATVVVDRGLFAVVRHPQYLGYMCLNLTFMLLSSHWAIFLTGFCAIVLLALFAGQEETGLIEKFGEAYRDYIERVPRFNIIRGVVRKVVSGLEEH